MRILHTSDWHLGASWEQHSRIDDHRLFLDWLLDTLRTEDIDLLLVAGDLFDRVQPSNEAQRQFFDFIAQLRRLPRPPVAILTAGNHDSPSLVRAPSSLAESLDVHLVGELPRDRADWAQLLRHIPAPRGNHGPGVVVAAIPYLHEYTLGATQFGVDQDVYRAELVRRFTDLHAHLAELAEARWPGVPRVAMGHLTIGATDREDAPVEIHRVGTISGLPVSIFGDDWDYVALGHIHRAFPLDPAGRVRYCGTPVPLTVREAGTPRVVLRVDLPDTRGNAPDIRTLPIPVFRELRELTGTRAEVLDQLRALPADTPLPPLIAPVVRVNAPEPSLDAALAEEVARLPKPILLGRVRQVLAGQTTAPGTADEPAPAMLQDMDPVDVFTRLYRQRHDGALPTDTLLDAFRVLLQDVEVNR